MCVRETDLAVPKVLSLVGAVGAKLHTFPHPSLHLTGKAARCGTLPWSETKRLTKNNRNIFFFLEVDFSGVFVSLR